MMGEFAKRMKAERRLAETTARIEELEVALRAALSFIQDRHTDPSDGHAQMVTTNKGASR